MLTSHVSRLRRTGLDEGLSTQVLDTFYGFYTPAERHIRSWGTMCVGRRCHRRELPVGLLQERLRAQGALLGGTAPAQP